MGAIAVAGGERLQLVDGLRERAARADADRHDLDAVAGGNVAPWVEEDRAGGELPVRPRELVVPRRDEVHAGLRERARPLVDVRVVQLDLEAALVEQVREQRRGAAGGEVGARLEGAAVDADAVVCVAAARVVLYDEVGEPVGLGLPGGHDALEPVVREIELPREPRARDVVAWMAAAAVRHSATEVRG